MKQVSIPFYKTKGIIEVDAHIAPLVQALNSHDFITTIFSCAGHNKEQFYIMFNFNYEVNYLLNKVFDYVIEHYKGPIKIEITTHYRKEFEDKVITIRSRTSVGLYCKLSENEKFEFCQSVIHGFQYWLYALIHKPNLYFCK